MQLPKDILRLILNSLKLSELKICRLVNKDFLLECDRFVKLRLLIANEPGPFRMSLSDSLEYFKNWPSTSKNRLLDLEIPAGGNYNQFQELFSYFSKLTNLRFFEMALKAMDHQNSLLLCNLPSSITRLEVGVKIQNPEYLELPIGLLSLKIVRIFEVNDGNLIFLTRLQNLSKLWFTGCKNITGKLFSYIPTSITSIKLWFNRDITSLRGLERLSNLQKIDITSSKIKNEDIAILPRSIKKLILYDLKSVNSDALRYLPPFLTDLELNSPFQLDGIQLPNTLKNLTLAQCSIAISTFKFPPNLQVLDIDSIDDSSSKNIHFETLPKTIKKLFISGLVFELNALLTVPKQISQISLFYTSPIFSLEDMMPIVAKFKEMGMQTTLKLKYQTTQRKWTEGEWTSFDN